MIKKNDRAGSKKTIFFILQITILSGNFRTLLLGGWFNFNVLPGIISSKKYLSN